MIQTLHCLKGPKPWELWYIPYYGSCGIYIINHIYFVIGFRGPEEFLGLGLKAL